MITNISKKTHLSDALFRAVRDRIVLGDYPAGQLLSEKELCEEFSVSRTPYREAIRKLEELKLVKVVPRFGSYVAEVDLHEAKCAYEVRLPLEVLAARMAARRRTSHHIEQMEVLVSDAERLLGESDSSVKSDLDRRCHQIIRAASQNVVLVETLNKLHLTCSRVWNSFLQVNFPKQEIVDWLDAGCKALKEGDEDTLADLMEQHMQKTHQTLKDRIF